MPDSGKVKQMKKVLVITFAALLIGSSPNGTIRAQDKDVSCEQYKYNPDKPVRCLIELLKDESAFNRAHAAANLGKLGPKAAEAVPALAELINDKDPNVRKEVFEALVKIADGSELSPAGRVLVKALAEHIDYQPIRHYAFEGLARLHRNRRLIGWQPLPGWVGLYPPGQKLYGRPVVSNDGKSYSQTLSTSNIGNATSHTLKETLLRDPSIEQKYAAETLARTPNPPKVFYAGQRRVLVWDLGEVRDIVIGECNASRMVVLLGPEKALIRESCVYIAEYKKPSEETTVKFSDEQLAFFDRAEAALEKPPRTNFRRTFALFEPLAKGMSSSLVRDYVGFPDQEFSIGDNMLVETYELLDRSTIVLRYAGSKDSYGGISWQLVYANRTEDKPEKIREFIK
jgi:hypothetical protein